MKPTEFRFSSNKASEILELAARYYTAENQTYTVAELVQAGSEVQIPDHLIRKAITDLGQQQQQQLEQRRKVKYCLGMVIGFSLIFTSAIASWSAFTYNHLVTVSNRVETVQKQVENQLQRRADLIPQLVNLSKTYANHEQEIITQLIQARQDYFKADNLEEKITAIAKLDRAILNFAHHATANQQLNSSQLFINLQYEITGTENRLAVERMRYNQTVQKYNREIQQFPQSLIAMTFHFEPL